MKNSVFDKKEECCGCGACVNICPKGAISIKKDEYGFTYPIIDKSKCINCKLCEKVCLFKNDITFKKPITSYAGQSIDDKTCKNSASGGIFYTIAFNCLNNGFIVYGSCMEFKDSKANVKHIRIDNQENLYKLQGSKYVQSSIVDCFKEVERDLLNGKKVLFSGTPCQIQAMVNYLKNKRIDIDNLYLIDIICHGVPSLDMFNSYLNTLYDGKEKVGFNFRDKFEGWGLMASLLLKGKKPLKKRIYPKISSYYYLFLNSDIYRDSCYNCKFASKQRVSDITIGDYWGIEKEHPEFLNELDDRKGISCILVNTKKGNGLLDYSKDDFILKKSVINKVSKYNHNLNKPSIKGENRDIVLNLYDSDKGFLNINKWYKKKLGIKYYVYNLWIRLPFKVRKMIRSIKK